MKFKRNAIFNILISSFLSLFIVSVLAIYLIRDITKTANEEQFKLMKTIVEFNLSGSEDKAIARAEIIACIPKIKELFAQQNREELLNECKTIFEIQRDKYGVEQAQFHLAPATSFLRLNAPEKFGDDLSTFRPMVVAVNKDKTLRKGVALARSGPAIFGVVPVSDSLGNHIGSFEIGLNFGSMLDKLKAAYGLESAVFIDTEMLKKICTSLSGDYFNEKNEVGKYLKYHSTNWDLVQNLVKDSDFSNLEEEKIPYERIALDNDYGVVIVPLRNAAGVTFGAIVVGKNFDDIKSLQNRSILTIVFISIFAFIFLTGVVFFIIGGGLVRPLNVLVENFKTLTNNNSEPANIDNSKLYCELKELAEQYEILKNKMNESENKN